MVRPLNIRRNVLFLLVSDKKNYGRPQEQTIYQRRGHRILETFKVYPCNDLLQGINRSIQSWQKALGEYGRSPDTPDYRGGE